MREITVYNTMTRQKEVFNPVTPGEAKMYVCGVTPYNHPHIGNARPFVTWDVIRRYMKHVGYKVTYVQNFTDVDDKIINTSNGEGVSWDTIANRYISSSLMSATCPSSSMRRTLPNSASPFRKSSSNLPPFPQILTIEEVKP